MPSSKAYRRVMRGVPSFQTISTLQPVSTAWSPKRGRTCRATKSGRVSPGTRSCNRLRISSQISALLCISASLRHAASKCHLELREVEVHEPGIIGMIGRRPLHEAPERHQVWLAPVEGRVEEVLWQLRPVILEKRPGRLLRTAFSSARLVSLGSHAVDVLAHVARRVPGSASVEVDDRDRVLSHEDMDVPELSVGLHQLQAELPRGLLQTVGLLEQPSRPARAAWRPPWPAGEAAGPPRTPAS